MKPTNNLICVEQVIELACEIAEYELDIFWSEHHPDKPINDTDGTQLLPNVQVIFDNMYDEIEAVIVSLMKQYPNKNINQIQDILVSDYGLDHGIAFEVTK